MTPNAFRLMLYFKSIEDIFSRNSVILFSQFVGKETFNGGILLSKFIYLRQNLNNHPVEACKSAVFELSFHDPANGAI